MINNSPRWDGKRTVIIHARMVCKWSLQSGRVDPCQAIYGIASLNHVLRWQLDNRRNGEDEQKIRDNRFLLRAELGKISSPSIPHCDVELVLHQLQQYREVTSSFIVLDWAESEISPPTLPFQFDTIECEAMNRLRPSSSWRKNCEKKPVDGGFFGGNQAHCHSTVSFMPIIHDKIPLIRCVCVPFKAD